MNDDFRDILAALLEEEVDFVVAGAHALAIHGVARSTGDIDLFVRPARSNAERVYAALKEFGAPVDAHGVRARDFSEPGTIYQLGLPPRRIDIMTSIDGVSFDEAWDGREEREIEGLRIPFLGRAELIRNKRSTGRARDRADLAMLDADAS